MEVWLYMNRKSEHEEDWSVSESVIEGEKELKRRKDYAVKEYVGMERGHDYGNLGIQEQKQRR